VRCTRSAASEFRRARLILELEQCMIRAGAENYDQGMQQCAKLLAFLQQTLDPRFFCQALSLRPPLATRSWRN
jgi:hypothetical protein